MGQQDSYQSSKIDYLNANLKYCQRRDIINLFCPDPFWAVTEHISNLSQNSILALVQLHWTVPTENRSWMTIIHWPIFPFNAVKAQAGRGAGLTSKLVAAETGLKVQINYKLQRMSQSMLQQIML